MAYEKRKGIVSRMRRRKHGGGAVAMGDLASTITGDINAAAAVVSDPYMPEVMCRINQLKAISANQPPQVCQDTPLGIPGGVGLGRLILPLRGFVLAQQYPILYPIAAFAILGLPFLIGYQMARTE